MSEYFFLKDSVKDFAGCGKYNAFIRIVDDRNIRFDDKLTSLDSLRFHTFEYLKNGKPNVSSSLKYSVQIPQTKLCDSISKGHFDVGIYNKPFPVKSLKLSLKEVRNGIKNYKEYLTEKWYKKPYIELAAEKKSGIEKLNETRLSFFDFSYMNGERIIPPPPPEFEHIQKQTEE